MYMAIRRCSVGRRHLVDKDSVKKNDNGMREND